MEEAKGYEVLMKEHGLTQEDVAQRMGKSRPAIANTLRLLALPDAVQYMLEEGTLSAGHARTLLGLSKADAQKKLAQKIVAEGLSVRQTEALVKRLSAEADETPDKPKAEDPLKIYRDAAAKELSQRWGRKVSIVKGAKKGKLELEFYNDEDLTLLLDQLEQLAGKGGGQH